MKKVKLGLQRGYSRNMPPKVFNGATSVSQARMSEQRWKGRLGEALVGSFSVHDVPGPRRTDLAGGGGRFQWSAEEAIQHRNSLLRFCWEVFSRIFVLSLCIKC
jgi:hypothetical protein